MTPRQHIRIFYIGVKDKVLSFFYWIRGMEYRKNYQSGLVDSRGRAKSSFLKTSENTEREELVDYSSPQSVIQVHKASEPLDILWKNMGVIDTHFAFTRFFLFVFGFIIIVFLSSPAVVLAKLQKIDPTSILTFDWTQNFGTMGAYLHKSLPPLMVILINLTVIILLDYASVIESYDSHSKY